MNKMKKYAQLIVEIGVNLQPKQNVVISASLEAAELVHYVVEASYQRGAKKVEVEWNDPVINKLQYQYEDIDTLQDIPEWKIMQKKELVDNNAVMINIMAPNPKSMKDIDSNKMMAVQTANAKVFQFFSEYRSMSKSQWVGLAVPSVEWATMIYPQLSDKEAVDKLWDDIYTSCRIEENNDPVALWNEHVNTLKNHRQLLTDYNFEKLIFKNGIGTDLEVGLVDNHQWAGGEEKTPAGIGFTPNLPTEEIFCMPHLQKTNGKVVSTKPLNVQGKLVEEFYFVFKDGKVVEYDAKVNKDALTNLLNMDEGASYLGEVALISNDSPISNMGLVFYNTLFDENASCHLALGNCYGSNLVNSQNMTKDQMIEAGANFSMIHVDFMFGSSDLSVVGVLKDGTTIQLFKDGNFII